MAYRIRYEVRRNKRYWWVIVGAVAASALTKPLWYWELARYVGEQIRGAG